jgi:hypothetical protein
VHAVEESACGDEHPRSRRRSNRRSTCTRESAEANQVEKPSVSESDGVFCAIRKKALISKCARYSRYGEPRGRNVVGWNDLGGSEHRRSFGLCRRGRVELQHSGASRPIRFERTHHVHTVPGTKSYLERGNESFAPEPSDREIAHTGRKASLGANPLAGRSETLPVREHEDALELALGEKTCLERNRRGRARAGCPQQSQSSHTRRETNHSYHKTRR